MIRMLKLLCWIALASLLMGLGGACMSQPPAPQLASARGETSAQPIPSVPDVQGHDPGPSAAVYPPQSIPLRFDHAAHGRRGIECAKCHAAARISSSVTDRLLPSGRVCDECHATVHAEFGAATAGPREDGACPRCHLGWRAEQPATVARVQIGNAAMKFSHRAHAVRNIRCGACHGDVRSMQLATRDSMPRMRTCLVCHNLPAESRGDASAQCSTCHLVQPGGRLQTHLPTGVLLPPRWLGRADHGADFAQHHQRAAADNSRLCASCHSDDDCAHCHDGRVRPRNIHPNDYLSMHPIAARHNSPRCSSCHNQQSFCLACHQRVGVTMSGPEYNRRGQGRLHPPPEVFTTGPRSSRHHGSEAQRNLGACVSCHTERDCASCHATGRGGGLGVNPHPAGFLARCASALHRNPRPCLVCHQPDEPILGACR
jgi:hypothetical protein